MGMMTIAPHTASMRVCSIAPIVSALTVFGALVGIIRVRGAYTAATAKTGEMVTDCFRTFDQISLLEVFLMMGIPLFAKLLVEVNTLVFGGRRLMIGMFRTGDVIKARVIFLIGTIQRRRSVSAMCLYDGTVINVVGVLKFAQTHLANIILPDETPLHFGRGVEKLLTLCQSVISCAKRTIYSIRLRACLLIR